jgi:UTP--glucose-1-phosphate uridylyltransferase
LTVSGLSAGHYLGFFGIHALTPAVLDICGRLLASEGRPSLSEALSELSRQEHYLGIISPAQRYNLGVRYGFFSAQLALALRGRDAPAVLARIIELLGSRHTERGTAV